MSSDLDDEAAEQADAEFDTMASWTVDAVRALGPEHAIPAGCRGSGSPAGLRWLGRRLGLAPGRSLLDVGAGMGGPAAYAGEHFGVDAVLVDPMAGACRAAGALFGAPGVVAPVEHLPLRGGSCDVIWCLGVLCSVDDLEAAMRELARVLAPGGRLGVLVYFRTVPRLTDEPAGNHFPSPAELDEVTSGAGLVTNASMVLDRLPAAPKRWQGRADEVDRWVERAHGHDPAWRAGRESEQAVGQLISTGQVTGHLRMLRQR